MTARQHRGPHPNDQSDFAPHFEPVLRRSVHELCWLLSRGYGRKSALELVGNRHQLHHRQRVAVSRASCGESERERRQAHLVTSARALAVDGFNIITTVEAALSKGVLLKCRDGSIRDMASLHGSYRRVAETPQAIAWIAEASPTSRLSWYLDRPVSNSGRLRSTLIEYASRQGLDWTVELVDDPDPVLKSCPVPVVTSDSAILDEASGWYNLAALIVERFVEDPWLVDLS